MKNRICDMLGIEFPVLAFTHCRDVVAAVSRAGGLGVLGAVGHSPEALEIDLEWIENETGGKPYGVDLLIPVKYVGQEEGGLDRKKTEALIPDEHATFMAEVMDRYQVPDLPARADRPSTTGLSLTHNRAMPLVDIALAHDIALIANALGPPGPDLVEKAHARGVKVAALAGKKSHAVRHAAAGADIIIAQGYEAGGHTGEVASMVLVPEVVDAVAPVPVLAAGGIGRGRQMAAAMALGAEGVWCGSVWLTTEESEVVDTIKDKFVAATSSDTTRSRSMTGKPARMLKSAWTQEWEREDTPDPLPMPLQSQLVARPQARIRNYAHASEGARELSQYFVGQVVGQADSVRPADRVLLDIVEEFADTIAGLGELLEE
ncbi:MAG: nitronate monooxygenase family protein [Actinomycetota bacterium]|nr:nitronate monooxygenase family protein [Actinomycetota bacterium]